MHSEPGQLLQRVKHLTAVADELVQRRAHDRDNGPITFDIHVDVAVEVGDIEQTFDVVSRYLALELQISRRLLGRPVCVSVVPVNSLVPVNSTVPVNSPVPVNDVISFIRGVREVFGTDVRWLFRWPTLRVSERVITMAHRILLVGAGDRQSRTAYAKASATLSACPTACCATAAGVAA